MSFESFGKQMSELPTVSEPVKELNRTDVDFDASMEIKGNWRDVSSDMLDYDPDKRVESLRGFAFYSAFESIYDLDKRMDMYGGILEDNREGSDLSYEQKVEKQEQEINDVETGKKDFDRSNTRETGNYGEMKTDQDLRNKGYERISNDMVTDIDENGHQGIDGIYYNPDGKPQYIIVDAKYGSAQLNPDTKDGKQMSENWIDKRLDQSVGKEKADEIRAEKLLNSDNVGTYVAHVDENGNVRYDKLDNGANVVEKDVKINA